MADLGTALLATLALSLSLVLGIFCRACARDEYLNGDYGAEPGDNWAFVLYILGYLLIPISTFIALAVVIV